jgi:hypothetical protein
MAGPRPFGICKKISRGWIIPSGPTRTAGARRGIVFLTADQASDGDEPTGYVHTIFHRSKFSFTLECLQAKAARQEGKNYSPNDHLNRQTDLTHSTGSHLPTSLDTTATSESPGILSCPLNLLADIKRSLKL